MNLRSLPAPLALSNGRRFSRPPQAGRLQPFVGQRHLNRSLTCLVLLGSVVMLQCYNNVSLLAPSFDVSVCFGDLLERIAPINDRSEFSRLS